MSQLKPLAPVGVLSPLYTEDEVNKLGLVRMFVIGLFEENLPILIASPEKFLSKYWDNIQPSFKILYVQIIANTGELNPLKHTINNRWDLMAKDTRAVIAEVMKEKAINAQKILAQHEGRQVAA